MSGRPIQRSLALASMAVLAVACSSAPTGVGRTHVTPAPSLPNSARQDRLPVTADRLPESVDQRTIDAASDAYLERVAAIPSPTFDKDLPARAPARSSRGYYEDPYYGSFGYGGYSSYDDGYGYSEPGYGYGYGTRYGRTGRSRRGTSPFPWSTAVGAGLGAVIGHQSGRRDRGLAWGAGLGLLFDLDRWSR